MKLKFILLCLLLLCLISTASARDTYEQNNVYGINYECPDGYVISNVNLDNLEANFNSTIVLDNFGEEYILCINNTKSIGHWYYDVSLTYPNGTTTTQTLNSFQPFATDTDIKIQYFYAESDIILDVDVYVGLLPLVANFTNPVSSESEIGKILSSTGLTYTRLAFSDVQASCNNEFDFKATYVTIEEFEAQTQESISEYLTGSMDLVASDAWDTILSVVESIPYIGPYFVSALEISAVLIDDTLFYFNLFLIEYLETTIMIIEFFILSGAIIKTRRKSNIFAIIDKIVNSHIKLFEFVFNIMTVVINIFTKFLSLIVDLINAIVPF